MTPAADEPLELRGPRLTLRYPEPNDAAALFELARDPAVTRFFSWGPYTSLEQPQAYIATLADKRERGEQLDLLIVHHEDGPIGITGLSELSRRNRHATVGTWFGHRWWGSGTNPESKAMMAALAFERLRLDRLTAWANTHNERSQVALERVGFTREGVLSSWHRHGDVLHDVVVYGMLAAAWEHSPLHDVPVAISGTPPAAFVVA